MRVVHTDIPDVCVIEPVVHGDARGFFMESWNRHAFADAGIDTDFVQDNHSRSLGGTLRGLHYQIPRAQGKLIRVTRGAAFDAVVDLRRSSPTFGRWVGVTLSEDEKQMLWVPPGFAHGFYALSDVCDVQYKCTDYYAPADERCIRWDDPDIGIAWPMPAGRNPTLSAKDRDAGSLRDADLFP